MGWGRVFGEGPAAERRAPAARAVSTLRDVPSSGAVLELDELERKPTKNEYERSSDSRWAFGKVEHETVKDFATKTLHGDAVWFGHPEGRPGGPVVTVRCAEKGAFSVHSHSLQLVDSIDASEVEKGNLVLSLTKADRIVIIRLQGMAHGVAERLHALALAAPHTEVQVDSAPPVTTGDLKPKHPGRESTGGNAANGQRRQREGSGEGHVASPKKQKKSEKATLSDKATLSPRKLACPSQEDEDRDLAAAIKESLEPTLSPGKVTSPSRQVTSQSAASPSGRRAAGGERQEGTDLAGPDEDVAILAEGSPLPGFRNVGNSCYIGAMLVVVRGMSELMADLEIAAANLEMNKEQGAGEGGAGEKDEGGLQAGDVVQGRYKDGQWYTATVREKLLNNRFVLAWADGDTQDTVKPARDLELQYRADEESGKGRERVSVLRALVQSCKKGEVRSLRRAVRRRLPRFRGEEEEDVHDLYCSCMDLVETELREARGEPEEEGGGQDEREGGGGREGKREGSRERLTSSVALSVSVGLRCRNRGCQHFREREEALLALSLPVQTEEAGQERAKEREREREREAKNEREGRAAGEREGRAAREREAELAEERVGVQTLLERYFSGTAVEVTCDKCGCKRADQSTRLRALPSYLVLHLKRFTSDYKRGLTEKLRTRVEITREVDLGAWVSSRGGGEMGGGEGGGRDREVRERAEGQRGGEPVIDLCDDEEAGGVRRGEVAANRWGEDGRREKRARGRAGPREGSRYELKGVVSHLGEDAEAGHYVSDVEGEDGIWYRYNDSVVKLEGIEPGIPSHKQRKSWRRNGYMLVYHKI